MRIDRMLAIVVILLNRRRIKARDLAERFEVSLRTIYRDIDAINLAGIPVISNQGVDGGYEIPDNYKLNKQYLSPSDMRSILLALKGVNAALDDTELATVFEKIQSLLPDTTVRGIHDGEQTVVFDTVGWDNSDRPAKKIQMIYEAIKSSHVIELTYINGQGGQTVRAVEPMTLFQKGFAWYLLAHCRKRNELRIFKLPRIKALQNLNRTFVRRPGNFRQVFEKWEPQSSKKTIVLKFSLEVRHIVEEYFEPASITHHDDTSIIVKAVLIPGDWLVGMILSYGDRVEVLSPESFRTDIRKKIEKMAAIYNKPDTMVANG